ncbi:MAG: regulatory protein GemA [Ignavibacteriae bacterium]|nr:regulatory protein GemA [Ignavibacteriota bacterium]NOG97057.1 regulatory protein GemA [Ignavibacteriota bacterium]
MSITRIQIVKIHIAKKELGLSSDEYKSMLESFNASSSKELSYKEAEQLLKKLMQLGWIPKKTAKSNIGSKRFSTIKRNSLMHATAKQLRMIEGMWMEVSREKTTESLNKFIKRIVGVDHIEWLRRHDVPKIVKALQSIYISKRKNDNQLSKIEIREK